MKIYLIKTLMACTATCASLVSCGQIAPKSSAKDNSSIHQNKTIPGNSFDSLQTESFFKKYPFLKATESQMTDFYSKRNFAYVWFDKGVLIEQAGNLASRILNFKSDGLDKSPPYHRVLDSLLNETDLDSKDNGLETQLDIMLTAQYFYFSKAAYEGIDVSSSRSSGCCSCYCDKHHFPS
jgi:hypothetical protein